MPDQIKRQRRSKVACEPCRTRKRKCDGRHPCETCNEFEYPCHYDLGARKKRNKSFNLESSVSDKPLQTQRDELVSEAITSQRHSSEEPIANLPHNSIESNSGSAFVRNLGLKIDPTNAPDPQVFAWNIGPRHLHGNFSALAITDIISLEEMNKLAHVYFDKIAPYYGFIDRATCFEYLTSRWLRLTPFEPYDVVLCGVGALGYLFSQRKAVAAELHLIESAKSALEQCSMSEIPPLIMVSGWALRLAYLRSTASPHTTWMASCSLLHLIEATGLHLDQSSRHVLIRPPQNINDDIRKRLVCFAQYINTWISFDLGRSRVVLHGASYITPPRSEGDYTSEVLDLLPVSESLDPYKQVDSGQLTDMLVSIMDSNRTQPPSILCQCNLVLCIFRRLRAAHSTVSGNLMSRVLALITKALACAREMVDAHCPWNHVANVPFQIVCTLLAVDSPEALSLLDDAAQTLKHVADVYDTDVMREAYRTAGLLILLQQRRKDHDAKRLNSVLDLYFPSASDQETPSQPGQNIQDPEGLRDLLADMPGIETFDFTEFFIADHPWDLLGISQLSE